MAASDTIIQKIQKLLALAGNNPNEHEAASAAAKAQDLMREHDLAMSDVEINQDPRTAGIRQTADDILVQRGKPGGWKVALYKAVAETSDCWAFVTQQQMGYHGYGRMIGRPQDIEIANYLYTYLVREIERLQQEYGATRWAELRDYAKARGITTHEAESDFSSMRRHPLKAKNDWAKGAVPAVIQSLRDYKRTRDQRTDSDRALVASKEQAIRDWYAQQHGHKTWDDLMAASNARRDRMAAVDTRTAAQKRRDDERLRQASARAWAKQERQARRETADLDWDAYKAGVDTGRTIGIRPGLD